METLKQYFARPETPSEHSPVGTLMATIVVKFPGISFNDARVKANALLDKAAKAKNYRFPRVLSEAEEEASKAQAKAHFSKVRKHDSGVGSQTNGLT
jgi:uncharacterized Fe-S cluster-containing MiaB family protein